MKKLLYTILIMGSFYSYAQNPVYGKYIKAIDSLDAANIKLSVNTISSTSGGLNIAPLSGQDINFDLVGAGAEIRFNGTASPEVTMALDGTWDFNSNVLTDIGSLTVDNINLDGNGINTGTNSFVIKSNTTDGTDDNSLTITAGGDIGTARGAYIQIYGNEVGSSLDGAIRYHTGNNTTHSKHVFFTSGSGKFQITNDGSVVAGSPTGSGKGFGTINAQGIFINDVAVSAGAHTTINTNADNRIITGSDTDNTLNGEADLTFGGGVLGVTGSLEVDDITLNGNDITTATNTDLTLAPNGTGILEVQSDATFSGNVALLGGVISPSAITDYKHLF